MKKVNMSLEQMLSMGIWERVPQPDTVFHMTHRDNLDSILKDGKITTGHDYICWFFTSLENMNTYITISNALEGRKYYDYDGKLHTAPPIVPSETVVLKMKPRYSEPLYWYREINTNNINDEQLIDEDGTPLTGKKREKALATLHQFDIARVVHYGAMKFKQPPEVLELMDVLGDNA